MALWGRGSSVQDPEGAAWAWWRWLFIDGLSHGLSHASKLSSQQVAPLIDSVSLKSLFTSSPIW